MYFQECLVITSFKKYYLVCLIIATLSTTAIAYFVLSSNSFKYLLNSDGIIIATTTTKSDELISKESFNNGALLKHNTVRLSKKVKKSRSILASSRLALASSYKIHTFYYAWYGNPRFDGYYKHWNHEYLPNWKQESHKSYPNGVHHPPEDIGSNYYPLLGCYSSRDINVMDIHFKQIRDAGIGVLVVSWTPPNFTDSPHEFLPQMFDKALQYDLKIALHIEPYMGRNPINLFDHLRHFLQQYYNHPALYKLLKPSSHKKLPVFYIYDSYLLPAIAWRELLSIKGNLSVRGTSLDGIFLGLLVDMQHRYHIRKSQFDGFYTYFATNGFTYGSTWKNWKNLAKYAVQSGLIFAPSVGPGYIDTEVRPWNTANTRNRRHGQYYDVAWRNAINSNVNYISITSFNEWHEGTQIEPAIPKEREGFVYLNYAPEEPYFYLNLTKTWIKQFHKIKSGKT